MRRFVESMLFGVEGATDPLIFGVTPAVMVIVVFAACYLPAWRAAATDALWVMRGDAG